MRLLVDAGADTTVAFGGVDAKEGEGLSKENLLATKNRRFRDEEVPGKEAAEEQQLNGVLDIRRLLPRLEVVHAVSLLWHNEGSEVRAVVGRAGAGARRVKMILTPPVGVMLEETRRALGISNQVCVEVWSDVVVLALLLVVHVKLVKHGPIKPRCFGGGIAGKRRFLRVRAQKMMRTRQVLFFPRSDQHCNPPVPK